MKTATPNDVLVVHPRHGYFGRDNQIPMGLIGLANSITPAPRGVFATELTDEQLRQARILLMDVHWFMGLDSARRIAARARRVNPDLRVVVGGYSATIFAADLLADGVADYVVRGDAERPLPLLIAALRNGGDLRDIPNVSGRGFANPLGYQLTRADYDRIDYLSLGWFPALDRAARAAQRVPYPAWIYPFVPVFKGCKFPCDYCLGNPAAQRLLCGRGIVSRSPERVAADLHALAQMPHVRRAYIIADFIHILEREYAQRLLSQRYDLDLYYEFYRIPRAEDVRRLTGSFRRVFLAMFLVQNHGSLTNEEAAGPALEQAVTAVREAGAALALNVHLRAMRDQPAASRATYDLYRRHRWINLIDSSLWDFPMPPVAHLAQPQPQTYAFFRAQSARVMWKWKIREWIVAHFFRGPRRHQLLFRLNTRFVARLLARRACSIGQGIVGKHEFLPPGQTRGAE